MTERLSNVLALILAGGLARRMDGRLKPLQLLGGERLIDRVIRAASAQCGAIALNLHNADPESQAPYADLALPIAADAAPGRLGPLSGVLGGLDFAARRPRIDYVLSLPCDCPFLPDDLASRLLNACQENGVACAASGGRTHPVVALWPISLREDLRRALIDGEQRAVGQFQRNHKLAVVEWPATPRDPFFNVNTPGDLSRAEDMLRQKA
jgi:molybdopterin-guanine dinucleotide biosynthesis protein A